jgi:hypothetical protein
MKISPHTQAFTILASLVTKAYAVLNRFNKVITAL